jgi:hypothetical protein
LRRKITSSKVSFQMKWYGPNCGYTGCRHIFWNGVIHANIANHDYGDGGVVDISTLDAYFRVKVCTPIFLGEASKSCRYQIIFEKKFKTQLDTTLNEPQHKQELLCGKIFGSGSIFIRHRSISKSRFNKIKPNSDITPPNNLDMVAFEILLACGFVSTKA